VYTDREPGSQNGNSGYNVYFAGKQIWAEKTSGSTSVINARAVAQDRLGSVSAQYYPGKYFPYGEEPTTTAQDRVKFATYYRDEATALDYAQQRYYARTLGRFTSPDPYGGSANLGNPHLTGVPAGATGCGRPRLRG
jgi:RHS repeat-associated protein